MNRVFGSLAIAGAMVAAVPAQAEVFDFRNLTGSTATWGNNYKVTSGSIQVTATGWSAAKTTDAATAAYLVSWPNGFGVYSRPSDDAHSIDNSVGYDFVMLTFSKAVRLTDLVRVAYDRNGNAVPNGNPEMWVSYGSGSVTDAASWGATNSFNSRGVDMTLPGTKTSVGAIGNNFSTVWLVGAARGTTSRDDYFKLSTITVSTVPAIPEPATWMMMILGFGAVGHSLRRRGAAVRVTYA